MRVQNPPNPRIVRAILALVVLTVLACEVGGQTVNPADPRIQPPTVNAALNIQDFLNRIAIFPRSLIPPPWIVQPKTIYAVSGDKVEIKGWGINRKDRAWPGKPDAKPKLVIYSAPSAIDSGGETKLGETEVGDDRNWALSVAVPKGRTNVVAKIQVGDRTSGRSNAILVFRDAAPKAPKFTSPKSPKDDTEESKIAIKGTAEPDWFVEVSPSNRRIKTGKGDWTMPSQELKVGDNAFRIDLLGADTPSDQLTVTRYEPIKISWPFGTGEGENYKPNLGIGFINTWFGDDWHLRMGYGVHDGIDIGVKEEQNPSSPGQTIKVEVHAVASGTVLNTDWDDCGGNFALINHGGWISYYGHLLEKPDLEIGKPVPKGKVIGKVDSTGQCTNGTHLHFMVRKWVPGLDSKERTAANFWNLEKVSRLNINPPATYQSNFKGKNIIFYDDYYGTGNYWDLDWARVNTNPDKLPDDYNNRCVTDFSVLNGDTNADGLGFRYRYCKAKDENCSCATKR